MARKKVEPEADDTPILSPFESTAFDVKVHLRDGSTEVLPVWGRGVAAAYMTALYTVQRWPRDKIEMMVGMDH